MLLRRIKFAIKLFEKLFGKYKIQIVALAFLGFLGGLMESASISLLIPVFSMALGKDPLDIGTLSQVVKNFFAFLIYLRPQFFTHFIRNTLGNINYDMVWLLALIPLLFFAKSALMVWFSYIGTSIGTKFEFETRSRLYRKALLAHWPYLLKQKIGHLENTLMYDIRMSAKLMGGMISFILDISSLFVYIIVAVSISYQITLITLSVGIVIFVVAQFFMQRTRHYVKRQTVFNKDIAHHINEHISGIKTIKAAGVERKVALVGGNFFQYLRDFTIRQSLLKHIISSLSSPLSILFIVIVFAISYKSPDFNLTIFIATIYIIQRIFIHINTAQKSLHDMNDFGPHFVSVGDLETNVDKNLESDSGEKGFVFKDRLEFRDVKFSYPGKEPVLDGISFAVKKGELVGVVGSSGSGKTTLVDLFMRFFYPQSGEIILDGVNINEIKLAQWRKNIGYMPQDTFLLNDTISNNIRFYDDSLSEEDIKRSAEIANAVKFIEKLSSGFETIIGEHGVLLSGGQKQRIALARTLARKPHILILDEATSSLDNESEALIQEAIENLKGQTTVIVIAHRVSTIMNADRLIALEGGKIKETGTPEELLKKKDSYFYRVNLL
ncbi:MAG: Permease and ATP-binding protein of an ABC transporter complex [Microgenomates group bacterium GW2011_GWC1_41_8]|uniref:ABC transporter n=5 Tax=Candidatus Giovannoniibacteriota TaxID=1752738 RepID=A0A1F5WXQ3_9BACT|nr:MAG: Permease and ATP-binding protein of an ABC transporter complex [Microgenomates group bacterium GW2011_GWC1_41_8]KKT74468.1 MAG: ABC-type multidrug transport system, ATPase and permease component [Parcubacteria group bacterium GW2011_GWB1_44_7]KKT78349.1 MAG: ABC-type multidrug transport system, ATPase and permease component [Candidatus Giovannonibacteria bacterium GW2011_GWC2_44_8]OGF73987.1 MAG: hypothetical protein A2W57_02665 [Candidatus Giovannonibacteria bacterium RIFCSPHIGHO2_02_43